MRFFGSYVGTVRHTGLSWILPLSDRRKISIRVRNFETNHLKVNDAEGNPVEIAAIVVWQVSDTSRALYAVDDYLNFVRVQAESALRHVATTHPYDYPAESGPSLRGSTDVVAGELAVEMARARCDRRAWKSSKYASVTLPTRPRLPRRCSADSRPTPSSRHAPASSRARSGWLNWHSIGLMSATSSTSMKNERQRW